MRNEQEICSRKRIYVRYDRMSFTGWCYYKTRPEKLPEVGFTLVDSGRYRVGLSSLFLVTYT